MRRPSRPTIIPPALSDLDPAATTSTTVPAVLHVYIDDTPATSPPLPADCQLDEFSAECRGSAVDQLRQFLDNAAESSTSARCCSGGGGTVPTAIQPGRAFDSLKYFLHTLP